MINTSKILQLIFVSLFSVNVYALPEEKALLKEIGRRPWDHAPRLDLAKWYKSHGYPENAEFIELSVAIHNFENATKEQTLVEYKQYEAQVRRWKTLRGLHVLNSAGVDIDYFEFGLPAYFPKPSDSFDFMDLVTFFDAMPSAYGLSVGNWSFDTINRVYGNPVLRRVRSLKVKHYVHLPLEKIILLLQSPYLVNLASLDVTIKNTPRSKLSNLWNELDTPKLATIKRLSVADDKIYEDSVGDAEISLPEFKYLRPTHLSIGKGMSARDVNSLLQSPLSAEVYDLSIGTIPNNAGHRTEQGFSDEDFANFKAALLKMKKLQRLKIGRILTSAQIKELFATKSWPDLVNVSLRATNTTTDDVSLVLSLDLRGFENVRKLDIDTPYSYHRPQVYDADLLALLRNAKNLGKLQELRFLGFYISGLLVHPHHRDNFIAQIKEVLSGRPLVRLLVSDTIMRNDNSYELHLDPSDFAKVETAACGGVFAD